MKKINNKNLLLFSLPIFIIFFIVLLAYYPGILVSDGIYQWHQAQTGIINDWHPAYNTIYILLLSKIWNNPFFVLVIQCLILSFSIGLFLYKLNKYYDVNKWYLFACSIILALIPLNYNSAVILLKDTLYAAFIVLLTSIILDIINNKDYFNKTFNCFKFGLVLLLIMLTRHNGSYAVILFGIIISLVYKKNYRLYISLFLSVLLFFLMTSVGYKILNIQKGNPANKYAPISHILGRILNENEKSITKEEYEKLSKYVNLESLKETYNHNNMDPSIGCQNNDMLRSDGFGYLKISSKILLRNPISVLKNYLHLNSYLYFPIPWKNTWYEEMFTDTDLYIFVEEYPNLIVNSKIPWLLPIIKKSINRFQTGFIRNLTMRPAIYMYLTIIISYILSKRYKNKKILLLNLFIICNTLFLSVAMPIAAVRYVYSTILVGYLMIVWFVYYLFKKNTTIDYSKDEHVIKGGNINMKGKKIAVLIPCYNESKTIEKVVKDFKKALPDADIYVYDNNSVDGTDKIAKKAGAIVKYEYRQGKGNVIRSMFRDLNYDCYLMIDGDDTYPAKNAKEMCDLVLSGKADMVIGDRLSSTYFKENKRRFHGFGNKLVRFLINKLFKSNIKDIMTGYRAFSYDFVKTVPILSKGFEIETEMTIHALDKNFKILEIPVDYKDRPEGSVSKLNTYSDGIKVLGTIMRLFKEYKPKVFFGFVSLVFFIISICFGTPVFIEYFKTGLVPRFPTLIFSGFMLMISILMLVCGIILEVVVKKHRQLFELYLIRAKKDEKSN